MLGKLNGLTYNELCELEENVLRRKKEFKRLRVRQRFVRCGKQGCACSRGPGSNSWGNLHGPYLYAQFVDKMTGKTKKLSLGLLYTETEVEEVLGNGEVKWKDYYQIDRSQRSGMSAREIRRLRSRTFTPKEFLEFYGLRWCHNEIDRVVTWYARENDFQAFEFAVREREEEKKAVKDPLCRKFGIGSKAGQAKLKSLLSGDYYLVNG